MRRVYAIYGAFLVALLLAAFAAVRLLHSGDVSASLGKLGKGEREFQEARQSLLLSARNPLPALFAFVNDRGNSRRARLQALEVLEGISRQQKTDTCGRYLVPVLADTSVDIRAGALKAFAQFNTMSAFRGETGI